MENLAKSPTITHLSWGKLEIEGQVFKDAKLFPGGCRAWSWKETGTEHKPGIQPGDVEELLQNGAQVVILSRGMLKALHVCPETIAWLEEKGIETHILPTEKAVELYNELRQTQAVGALIHSTC